MSAAVVAAVVVGSDRSAAVVAAAVPAVAPAAFAVPLLLLAPCLSCAARPARSARLPPKKVPGGVSAMAMTIKKA